MSTAKEAYHGAIRILETAKIQVALVADVYAEELAREAGFPVGCMVTCSASPNGPHASHTVTGAFLYSSDSFGLLAERDGITFRFYSGFKRHYTGL